MNGEPLPHWNGAPARLVVPGWTATYWVKAPRRPHRDRQAVRRLLDEDGLSRAERHVRRAAASNRRTPSRIRRSPRSSVEFAGHRASAGRHARARQARGSAGIAWDGGSGIRSGRGIAGRWQSWRDAKLGRDLGRYAWRQWRFAIKPEQAGAHDADGPRSRSRRVDSDRHADRTIRPAITTTWCRRWTTMSHKDAVRSVLTSVVLAASIATATADETSLQLTKARGWRRCRPTARCATASTTSS